MLMVIHVDGMEHNVLINLVQLLLQLLTMMMTQNAELTLVTNVQ